MLFSLLQDRSIFGAVLRVGLVGVDVTLTVSVDEDSDSH
jgi:hypothetical protein